WQFLYLHKREHRGGRNRIADWMEAGALSSKPCVAPFSKKTPSAPDGQNQTPKNAQAVQRLPPPTTHAPKKSAPFDPFPMFAVKKSVGQESTTRLRASTI